MRKVVAGALVAAALSWANGARAADDAAKERREAADATKAEAKEAGRDAQHSAQQSMDRAADQTRAQTSARPSGDDKKHPLFEGKNNFDVKGKVAQVSGDSITIQRDELPEAKLHVSQNTKVEVDGKRASHQQLQRGQDVKASFNLQGDKVEAVEIKADKPKTDDRKEMQEQSRENQQDAAKRQQQQQK